MNCPLRIDHRKSLKRRKIARNLIGRHEVIDEFLIPKLQRHSRLQLINGAESQLERVSRLQLPRCGTYRDQSREGLAIPEHLPPACRIMELWSNRSKRIVQYKMILKREWIPAQ